MSCGDRYRLSRYLDGESRGEERLETQEHLERCARCRDALESLRESRRFIRYGALAAPAPAGMTERILGAVDRPFSDRREALAPIVPLIRRLAVAASILFLLLTIVLYMFSANGSSTVEAGPPRLETEYQPSRWDPGSAHSTSVSGSEKASETDASKHHEEQDLDENR